MKVRHIIHVDTNSLPSTTTKATDSHLYPQNLCPLSVEPDIRGRAHLSAGFTRRQSAINEIKSSQNADIREDLAAAKKHFAAAELMLPQDDEFDNNHEYAKLFMMELLLKDGQYAAVRERELMFESVSETHTVFSALSDAFGIVAEILDGTPYKTKLETFLKENGGQSEPNEYGFIAWDFTLLHHQSGSATWLDEDRARDLDKLIVPFKSDI